MGALTTDGQTATMAQALVATDLHLATDVLVDVATEVTLDLQAGVDVGADLVDLFIGEVDKIRAYIDASLKVEGDLRRDVDQDIRRKMEIGCYQGLRHRRGLPVRGQRTHTNARTRKGPKKTVAGKKKVTR